MAAPQPRPSDSFVERFSVLVRGSPKRRVDLELRLLDVALSAFMLLLALPLLLLIGIALLLTSGLPLFYRGQRVGRDGRIFEMLKFRTLRGGAEQRLGPYLGSELVEHFEDGTSGLEAHPGEVHADVGSAVLRRKLFGIEVPAAVVPVGAVYAFAHG